MDLTPVELQRVATSRYWKAKSGIVVLGLLVIVNILGLGLLGLYLTDNFPPETVPLEYSLDGTNVTIEGRTILLNGEEMQQVEREEVSNPMVPYYSMSSILLLGYILYHFRKARIFGRDLLEETISKEKLSGQ